MAFIPAKNRYDIGETVILKNEHKSCAGTFESGTEVKVTGIGPHGYDIEDEFGNRMLDCGWDL